MRASAYESSSRPRNQATYCSHPRNDVAAPAVWSDDVAAVDEVVRHLVGLGHRRIARVAGLPLLDHTHARIEAFRDAMGRHGLEPSDVVVTDYSAEQGAAAVRNLLLREDPPAAVTLDNDVMAVAGLAVARELGVAVPDELTIVAGDDSQLCTLVHPSLTALSRDVGGYGAKAARTLLAQIEGEHPDDVQDATSRLVVRGSSAPPARLRD